jgi:hypothetical protein
MGERYCSPEIISNPHRVGLAKEVSAPGTIAASSLAMDGAPLLSCGGVQKFWLVDTAPVFIFQIDISGKSWPGPRKRNEPS